MVGGLERRFRLRESFWSAPAGCFDGDNEYLSLANMTVDESEVRQIRLRGVDHAMIGNIEAAPLLQPDCENG